MANIDKQYSGGNPKTLKENPAEYITNLYEAVKLWRQPYEDRWKKHYRVYRSYRDQTVYPFKSNLFVPYVFSIVETVVPKMLGTIFNTRPIISVQARQGANEQLAKVMERILEYQLDDERLEFFSKILEFFKECAIYGTSFLKVIPKFNDDELVTFNYIDVEPIDLFNIFPDYRAKSIRRMKYIIQLSYIDLDDLYTSQAQGFYKNVKDVEQYIASDINVDQYKRDRLTDIGRLDEYGFDSNRRVIEVLEYWDKDKIYTIGARKVILKEEDNPFDGLLPFIMARYIPVQHEVYGIGIPEIAEDLQEELNTVRNQRMDNVNLIINRMFIANKYADIDMSSLVSYPGNVILTNDIKAIEPLDTRDVTKSAYMEEEIIKHDIDNACFDFTNVDVLTRTGWKKFIDVTKEDEVATRTSDGELEYNKPLNILIFEEKERELYRFNSRNIEGDYTLDHRFPVVGDPKPIKDFIKLYEATRYSNYKVPLTAKWNCELLPDKVFDNGLTINANDWLSFLGIYLAEGWSSGTKGGTSVSEKHGYKFGICQTEGTEAYYKIQELLDRIGLHYIKTSSGFVMNNKTLWTELFRLGNSHTKYIPRNILEAPPEQLQILFDWMVMGDGWKERHENYTRTRYFTVSKQLADDVQEVLIKLGLNGNIIKVKPKTNRNGYMSAEGYGIEVKNNKHARFQHRGKLFLEKITKTCKIGCFHLKNHTFMIRVNGKAFWTGNTGEFMYMRGAPPERRETATGIVRLQQAATARFDTVVKMLEFTVIRHISKMFLWLDYQFLPKEELQKILGPEDSVTLNAESFYQQPVDVMLKQYNFQPMGSSTTAIREVRIQQVMQAYKLFQEDPMINQMELKKMVLDVLDIKNQSKLLLPAPSTPEGSNPPQPGQGQHHQGGPNPPNAPKPPQPGNQTLQPEQQLSEMSRIAGGGLIKKQGPAAAIQQGQMG